MRVRGDLSRPYSRHLFLLARNLAHRALAAAAIFALAAADILRRFLPEEVPLPADKEDLIPGMEASSRSSSSMRCLIVRARFSCTTVNVAKGLVAIRDALRVLRLEVKYRGDTFLANRDFRKISTTAYVCQREYF